MVILGPAGGTGVFGHAAVATTGSGFTSLGGAIGPDFTGYLQQNEGLRSETVYLLPTTSTQESAIRASMLDALQGGWTGVSNCSSAVMGALDAAGVGRPQMSQLATQLYEGSEPGAPIIVTPIALGLMIQSMPGVQAFTLTSGSPIPSVLSQFNVHH